MINVLSNFAGWDMHPQRTNSCWSTTSGVTVTRFTHVTRDSRGESRDSKGRNATVPIRPGCYRVRLRIGCGPMAHGPLSFHCQSSCTGIQWNGHQPNTNATKPTLYFVQLIPKQCQLWALVFVRVIVRAPFRLRKRKVSYCWFFYKVMVALQ